MRVLRVRRWVVCRRRWPVVRICSRLGLIFCVDGYGNVVLLGWLCLFFLIDVRLFARRGIGRDRLQRNDLRRCLISRIRVFSLDWPGKFIIVVFVVVVVLVVIFMHEGPSCLRALRVRFERL